MSAKPPCVCGHSWSAHLPLAGSTVGRCTVDCLDRCGEYIASAPRQVEAKPAGNPMLDTALTRADHARAEFCCWCSRDEACRLLALCDALDAARATLALYRGTGFQEAMDRAAQAEANEAAHRQAAEQRLAQSHAMAEALDGVKAQRDQARAALARVEALITRPFRGVSVIYPYEIRAAIAGDEPLLCARCGRPGREHERDLFNCPGPPTHLPLSEVLELAADLARRASTPPDPGSGT